MAGTITTTSTGRELVEDAPGVQGDVVIGTIGDTSDYELFLATNATNFPQGTRDSTLTVALSDSEECTTEAYDNALKYPLKEAVAFPINEVGMIEGLNGNGWINQTIHVLEGNSTLPISLLELMSGVAELIASGEADFFNGVTFLDYGLAVYALGAEEELLGCASMKILDNATAAEYHKVVHGFSQEAVMDVPSSASKNGLFVFLSAIAAVGMAFVLGDVLAL